MRSDPIVDEVRRVRDEHASRFNYELDAIFDDLKTQERRSGARFVKYPARRAESVAVSESHSTDSESLTSE